MKLLNKFKLSVEWWYTILTIYLPIIIFLLFTVIANRSAAYRWDAVWSALYPFFDWIGYILIPVGINLAFGPSILAFWAHKKSRVILLILNLIAFGLF